MQWFCSLNIHHILCVCCYRMHVVQLECFKRWIHAHIYKCTQLDLFTGKRRRRELKEDKMYRTAAPCPLIFSPLNQQRSTYFFALLFSLSPLVCIQTIRHCVFSFKFVYIIFVGCWLNLKSLGHLYAKPSRTLKNRWQSSLKNTEFCFYLYEL